VVEEEVTIFNVPIGARMMRKDEPRVHDVAAYSATWGAATKKAFLRILTA
jgi:hypothetical protein